MPRLPPSRPRAAVTLLVMATKPKERKIETAWIENGYLVAAADIALARPAPAEEPVTAGVLEAISVAPGAGDPIRSLESVRAFAGRGLDGDDGVMDSPLAA